MYDITRQCHVANKARIRATVKTRMVQLDQTLCIVRRYDSRINIPPSSGAVVKETHRNNQAFKDEQVHRQQF